MDPQCPEKSFLTSSSSLQQDTPIDRFHAIRQKIDRYTHARAISKETEIQEKLASRILQVEERLWEEEKQLQERVLSWREWLSELKVQAMHQEKRQAALRQERAYRIKQLRDIVKTAQEELQAEEKRAHSQARLKFEGNFNGLCRSLEKECNEQVAQTNQFQKRLQTELPSLHQRITTTNQYLSSVCQRHQKELIKESYSFHQLLQDETKKQEKGEQAMLGLICGAIQEMAHDLQAQRQRTRDMKEKLLFLISKAAGGIQGSRENL